MERRNVTMGTRTRSRYIEISSVGQLRAETMGLPVLFCLWILGVLKVREMRWEVWAEVL